MVRVGAGVTMGSPIVQIWFPRADLGPVTGSTSDRGNVYGDIMVDIEAKGSKFP